MLPRGLHHAIRGASPHGLRISVALARRAWRDSSFSGARISLVAATEPRPRSGFPHIVLEVVQEIRKSAYFEGKLANLRLGAKLLDGVVIAPGEVLSFWKLIGCPAASAGFERGRAIRGGAVGGEVGGGLCQLSGIVYEAGLRAGLDPVERHPHSRDLYAEEDRFTPLGLDATVVWPYKDLRLANGLAVPVQFRFAVGEARIAASIHSAAPLQPATFEISRIDKDGRREVRVVRRRDGGEAEPISDDSYAAMPAEAAPPGNPLNPASSPLPPKPGAAGGP
ncbi:MAG TPA: VanW family protein [Allosphingosinicella sp.]|jgi:vancomycin resistance protein VanW